MRATAGFAALMLALTCQSPRREPQTVAARQAALEQAMPGWMARHHVPGVAVAMVVDGELAWTKGFGVEAAGGASVTPDTQFQGASLGKPLFAQLYLEACASQGWPLEEAIPVIPGKADSGVASRASLLSHSSGLTRDPRLDRAFLDPTQRGRWRYSGPGFLALQRDLAQRTGLPLDPWAQQIGFGP